MNEASERALFEHIGDDALAYLLATDLDTLRTRLQDPEDNRLTAPQEEVLAQLVAIDLQMQAWQSGLDTSSEWAARLSGLSGPDPKISLGNLARRVAGGDVPEAGGGSPLERALLKMALDCYPGQLVKEPDEPFWSMGSLSRSLFSNPENKIFQNAVQTDPVLSRLYTEETEHSGPVGSVIRSVGSGGTVQLWTLADTLLDTGWTLASLATKRPTSEEFSVAVLSTLDTLRAAVQGDLASVPARMGLTGALFPDGIDEMKLGWARIRRADERDEHWAKRSGITGQLTGTNSQGETAVISYQGDLVLELDAPYVLAIRELDITTDPWPEALLISARALEEAVENLRLGLLLAFPEKRVVLHSTWQTQVDPLSRGLILGWNDVTRSVGLMPTRLTRAQVKDWQRWATKIGSRRIPTIAVAVRRMLASVAERRTMEDILVDAVIVWENLFGAKTETTLRVSSSLAWLLGTSRQDRRDRQTRYKKIYEFRSRVVHGTPNVNQRDLQTYALEAVQISIDALRAIFDQHPDLLDIESSEERSLEIMHRGDDQRPA
jgi:hypothetical protein